MHNRMIKNKNGKTLNDLLYNIGYIYENNEFILNCKT